MVKIGIFPYIKIEDVFMCTDRQKKKEGQGATSVHSITRTRWKTQPLPSTAEIDSIAPGMTAISSDRGMKEQHTQYG